MPNSSRTCTGWCAPTIIYMILAGVSTLLSVIHPELEGGRDRLAMFIAHLLNGAFWTGVLYLLCLNCWNTAAWIFLIIPFILAFVLLLLVATLAVALLKKGRHQRPSEQQHAEQHRENMANMGRSPVYGMDAGTVPGSKYPDSVDDFPPIQPNPKSPSHIKRICAYSARPSKFDVLTQQQLNAPGSYMLLQGYDEHAGNMPTGCHEGFPPDPKIHFTMPPDQTDLNNLN